MSGERTKRKGRLMWGLIYVAAFLVTCAASAAIKLTYNPLGDKYSVRWDDSMGTIHTDLSYGDGAANKFDLYVPADDGKETYGLVIYLHAGGFTGGDKAGDADMLKWLCSKGYVAAGVNYTLRDEAHPGTSVYTQSQEIQRSIPSIMREAERLGYPLDRMASSAGGCLALIYAYRDADTSPLPVRMVFEAVGPASFHREDWKSYGLDQSDEAAAYLFSVMSGNTITPDMIAANAYDDAVKDISAYMWIDETSAPTVCAYGAHDKVCPFGSAKHLVDALEQYGVPHEYIELPHSGHGLQNDDKLYAAYMDRVTAYLDTYMSEPTQ